MTERANEDFGPITKLIKFFCPDVEFEAMDPEGFQWFLLNDWDTQINKKSDSDKHPWLVRKGATPAGFVRWNRSTTRAGNAPSRLFQKAHMHFGCNINELGWVQVGEPQIRGAHLLAKYSPSCEEVDSDWLYSFELCRKQIEYTSVGNA